MPDLLNMLSGSLPPTATHARRDWYYWDGDDRSDGRRGTLTLMCAGSRRPGAVLQVDSYGIQDSEREGLPPEIREFLVLKDDSPSDCYRVAVGRWTACTCTAGCVRQVAECRHVAMCKAILEAGGLE